MPILARQKFGPAILLICGLLVTTWAGCARPSSEPGASPTNIAPVAYQPTIKSQPSDSPFLGNGNGDAKSGGPPPTTEITPSPPQPTYTPAPETTIVWPTFRTVGPTRGVPGDRVDVTGHGGYIMLDGDYLESSKVFDLYFNGRPAGLIKCYVNSCDGTFTVPANTSPGPHQVATEGGPSIIFDVLSTSTPYQEPTPRPITVKQIRDMARRGFSMEGMDLSGRDLSGIQLNGINLARVNFSNTNLTGAGLANVDLRGANLTGANLLGADLRVADLGGADLTEVNLSGHDLTGAKLVDSRLAGADLSQAVLRGVSLHGADLSGANLFEAVIEEGDLTDANLSGANLTQANLEDADLRQAYLTIANLTGARLVNADLSQTQLIGTVFTDADLDGAIFSEASFDGAILFRTNWAEAYCDYILGVKYVLCTENFLEAQGVLLR